MSWQYNGTAAWMDVIEWCNRCIPTHYTASFETILFNDAKSYTLFLMRWS